MSDNPASDRDEDSPTIYTAVGEACDRYTTVDSVTVAHRALADSKMRFTSQQVAFLLPAVVVIVEQVRRGRVHRLEQDALPKPQSPRRPVRIINSRADMGALRLLLNQTFKAGRGGEVVTWRKATAEQHRQRIDGLRVQSNGLAETIARHERAIALIQEAGVTCLGEVVESAA